MSEGRWTIRLDHAKSARGIRWTMTDRGFKHYEPVETASGFVEVYESSAAESPHLWVDAAGTTTHMTLDEAAVLRDLPDQDARLRDTLAVAISRHYQMPQPDPAEWEAGDQCVRCGSTETGLDDDVAFCRGCGIREDEDA